MARPPGQRNADYERSRQALLKLLAAHLVRPGGAASSFRELAVAAGVTPPTLRHYFQTREALIHDVLRHQRQQGDLYLQAAATVEFDDVEESLGWLLRSVAFGWKQGVGAVHMLGLNVGLGSPTLGPAYLEEVLEPTLQAAEVRLARHVERKELGGCDVRHAALELLSPLVLGLLHQDGLFGSSCRPLDLDAFLDDHLKRFLLAHAPKPLALKKR